MEALKKLIDICKAYKNSEFGIEEFQRRMETVYLPDESKSTLEKVQYNAYNMLEEILYCYGESKEHADKVADDLIQAAVLEQKQLSALKPYQGSGHV